MVILGAFYLWHSLEIIFEKKKKKRRERYKTTDVSLIGNESSAHITNNPLDFLNSAVRSEQHVNGGVGGGGGGGDGSLTFSSPASTLRLNDQNAVTSQVRHIHREQFIINSPAAGYNPNILISFQLS